MRRPIFFCLIILLLLCWIRIAEAAPAKKASKSAKPPVKNVPKKGKAASDSGAVSALKEADIVVKREVKYTGFDAKRDPFDIPAKLVRSLKTDKVDPGSKESTVKLPAVEIQAIIWSKRMPQLIANDAVMKTGDFIGEFEIKEIIRDGMILFFKGREYTIKMQNAPAKKGVKKKR